MAIYVPGRRDRHNRPLRRGNRNVVAILSLTAMVDMFTVLVIFLLKQYAATGQIIYLPKEVKLPEASEIKELKPAHVVTVSNESIIFDEEIIAKFNDLKSQEEWVFVPLRDRLVLAFREAEAKRTQGLTNRFRQAVNQAQGPGVEEDDQSKAMKVTVQADKKIDMLSIKKVLMTVTEAGAKEINFAVIKKEVPGPGAPASATN